MQNLANNRILRHQKLEHFVSAFKILTFTWMRRVFMRRFCNHEGFYIPYSRPHSQILAMFKIFFPVMIFISSVKDAQGCKIPEYPHAARQPLVQPLHIWIFEFNNISWFQAIISMSSEREGW